MIVLTLQIYYINIENSKFINVILYNIFALKFFISYKATFILKPNFLTPKTYNLKNKLLQNAH